jgi:soluble lytic murein transglycosylase-like protein
MSFESISIKEFVRQECRRNKISPALFMNLIHAESSWRPHAMGKLIKIKYKGKYIHTRAIGLCQIIPELHYQGNKYDLFNPKLNIKIGIRIYKNCLRKAKGNRVQALRYYNGQVKNKNNKYIEKILKRRI